LPSDTVDLIEHVIRTNGAGATQADLSMSRISVSTYASIPNKLATGRPIQVYIDRISPTPTVNLWPVPDTAQVPIRWFTGAYAALRTLALV
jgi:hypothetical protein